MNVFDNFTVTGPEGQTANLTLKGARIEACRQLLKSGCSNQQYTRAQRYAGTFDQTCFTSLDGATITIVKNI